MRNAFPQSFIELHMFLTGINSREKMQFLTENL